MSGADQPPRAWDDPDPKQQTAPGGKSGHWHDPIRRRCPLETKSARFEAWPGQHGIQSNA
jgi:hypothetical protein